jgi:hypothetical protein
MPDPGDFSVSWVALRHGETLQPHTHPIQSMMVVYDGSGDMLGDLNRPIAQGDIIVVPPGQRHGFVGGPHGLRALSIQFGDGLYTNPERPRVIFGHSENSWTSLLSYNKRRCTQFREGPLFDLLSDGTLASPSKRRAFLGACGIWTEGLLRVMTMTTRDAPCGDHRSPSEHGAGEHRDTVIEAITSWFAYQMFILDDAEKAVVVQLVVEKALTTFEAELRASLGSVARDTGGGRPGATGVGAIDAAVLAHEVPQTYVRLRYLVGEAWDMIGAIGERVTELTRVAE